jgi:hypothetical protein
MINPTGLKEAAVRGLIRSVDLKGCYQNGLRAVGARVGPLTPTINLSVSGDGKVTAATVLNLAELPVTARCIQGALGGRQLPSGSYESAGGTAEVFLTLTPE